MILLSFFKGSVRVRMCVVFKLTNEKTKATVSLTSKATYYQSFQHFKLFFMSVNSLLSMMFYFLVVVSPSIFMSKIICSAFLLSVAVKFSFNSMYHHSFVLVKFWISPTHCAPYSLNLLASEWIQCRTVLESPF